MLLKVGELARSSGLTVRTLHHYDEIGLLTPSGRSDAGYRLYSDDDVARLHGIQALRHLGLSLGDIGSMLGDNAPSPDRIIEQQMKALDRQIEQATELRGRLALIRDDITQGAEPQMRDWLQALSLMATYGKYFSAEELRKIFNDWDKIEVEWERLVKEISAFMAGGGSAEAPEAQVFARRWMALVHHWMGGDFELMTRWGEMYKNEPGAHGRKGGPPKAVYLFMQRAADIRMEVVSRHFTMEQLQKIRYVPEHEWHAMQQLGQELVARGVPVDGPEARAAATRWLDLVNRLVSDDAAMRRTMLELHRTDPVMQAASVLTPVVRDFLLEAVKALDPHAT